MPRESYTQGKILKYLSARGGYWVKYHASFYTSEGVPDILGCYFGLFIAFEVKNVNKKNPYKALAQAQVDNVHAIRESDGLAFAVNSIAQVEAILNEIDTARGK